MIVRSVLLCGDEPRVKLGQNPGRGSNQTTNGHRYTRMTAAHGVFVDSCPFVVQATTVLQTHYFKPYVFTGRDNFVNLHCAPRGTPDRANRVRAGTSACSFATTTRQPVPQYNTVCAAPAFGSASDPPTLCAMQVRLERGLNGRLCGLRRFCLS